MALHPFVLLDAISKVVGLPHVNDLIPGVEAIDSASIRDPAIIALIAALTVAHISRTTKVYGAPT